MPQKSRPKTRSRPIEAAAKAGILAGEALSFLRETRGLSTWTARDLASSLGIRLAEARRVIAALEMQGYVHRAPSNQWMTTFAGESVSQSRPPRYTRERIEQALTTLSQRIAEINRDSGAPFRITQAIAFGDFLRERVRFQPVEVGIELEPRKPAAISIVPKHQTRQQFLRQLRGKGGVIQFRRYEAWMRARSRRNLLR
jgi:hypothetical protein